MKLVYCSGSEGLPDIVHHNPSTDPGTSRDTYLRGKAISDSGGSDKPLRQRGYRGGSGSGEPGSFYLKDISCGEKGQGLRPVVNLKDLNQFVKWEHFKMEGLHLLPSRRLGGEAGPQGCLSAGRNPARPSAISSISLSRQNLPVQVPPIWAVSSTSSLYKAAKTSSGPTATDGNKNDDLSGQYSYTPQKQDTPRTPCLPNLPTA